MIRFRRWSRKSYSMFASIGKYVTIGQVCKSIAEASLSKTNSLSNMGMEVNTSNQKTDSPPMFREKVDSLLQELQEFLTVKIILLCLCVSNKANHTIPNYIII